MRSLHPSLSFSFSATADTCKMSHLFAVIAFCKLQSFAICEPAPHLWHVDGAVGRFPVLGGFLCRRTWYTAASPVNGLVAYRSFELSSADSIACASCSSS